MRSIFEFHGDPQVSFSGRRYVSRIDTRPEWTGMFVEGVICDAPREGQEFAQEKDYEILYLEGDLDSVRSMCKDVLAQLDMLEAFEKENFEEVRARTVQCEKCLRWYDPRFSSDGHADGQGNLCLGKSAP